MTKEEIISMLSKELNSEWTNGVTCLMVENSDSYIPVIVHHNKNELIVSVQELLDIECVLGVIVGGVLVVRVLGQVVLVAHKRAHTPQLQDALAAIQHRQFIPAHKFVAEFLIVGAIAWAIATGI